MLKFLTNTNDPNDKYAKMYVSRHIHETQDEAWENNVRWLKGKIIGEPRATDFYTVEQLKELGLVGVYIEE